MKPVIVYVYAPIAGVASELYAMRFLESYNNKPPGTDHDSIVVLNGVKQSSELACLFSSLRNCRFIEHDNSGYDIGSFQHAARAFESEMMVFFGASTFFVSSGWLIRMVNAYNRHGRAQYGAMGNRGNPAVNVWPHIRTTAFWMPTELMNSYPNRITKPSERHPFEHGKDCFTSWVEKMGLKNWVITRKNDLLWKDWDSEPNGYSRGNQSDMLAGDRMCERPYYPNNKCRYATGFCNPWKMDSCGRCLSRPPT
jgi:hypothetical protein